MHYSKHARKILGSSDEEKKLLFFYITKSKESPISRIYMMVGGALNSKAPSGEGLASSQTSVWLQVCKKHHIL